jgi:hypothetical protein
MNCVMSPVVLSMAMAVGAPSAYAEPPTVRKQSRCEKFQWAGGYRAPTV